jgi:hypothetical protein
VKKEKYNLQKNYTICWLTPTLEHNFGSLGWVALRRPWINDYKSGHNLMMKTTFGKWHGRCDNNWVIKDFNISFLLPADRGWHNIPHL